MILGCRPELARLLAGCDGVARIVAAGQPLPSFDVHSPLLSIPLFCGTQSPESVPHNVPYIPLSEETRNSWKARLPSAGPLRVGLC